MRRLRVVAGVIIEGGRVLAAQRPEHKDLAGAWELPGGKVEPGESDAEALARELREELDVDIEVGAAVAEAEHRYPDKIVLLCALRCEVRAGRPRAVEHAALRWVGAAELRSLDWAPADVPLLAAVEPLLRD